MRIFANDDVKEVSKTKIATWMTKDGKVVTVYSNAVRVSKKVKKANAMILPVPCKDGNIVKLFNLEKYEGIFDDLEDFFPKIVLKSLGRGGDSFDFQGKRLEIVEVGGYKVSIAYGASEIANMDKSVFVVDELVVKAIQERYDTGFAFVICVFANKNVDPHPIAYMGDLTTEDQIFIPTLHIHGDGLMSWAGWDHTTYIFNPKKGGVSGVGGQSTHNDFRKFDQKLQDLDIPCPVAAQDSFLYKEVIKGNRPNKDTFYTVNV